MFKIKCFWDLDPRHYVLNMWLKQQQGFAYRGCATTLHSLTQCLFPCFKFQGFHFFLHHFISKYTSAVFHTHTVFSSLPFHLSQADKTTLTPQWACTLHIWNVCSGCAAIPSPSIAPSQVRALADQVADCLQKTCRGILC